MGEPNSYICRGCTKPVSADHAFRLIPGGVEHVNCEDPMTKLREPKVIEVSQTSGKG